MSRILLEGRNLIKTFPAGKHGRVQAVSDVSVSLREGETLGLVGESGCGKSTLGRLLIRTLQPDSGEILFRDQPVSRMDDRSFRPLRRQMQMIFQDPYASLDPRMTVRDLIAEPLVTWKLCPDPKSVDARVLELMDAVGVPAEALRRYPHQFSGGQRQRIGIARALAADPAMIFCDEPVSALDVSIQNQILNLLHDLRRTRHLTYLFVSHDLNVVRHISDRISVMFLGRICETGPAEEVFRKPLHPYTDLLLRSVPRPDPAARRESSFGLAGEMPSVVNPPSGCRFRTRCPLATALCAQQTPPVRVFGDREAACHHMLWTPACHSI